MGFSIEVRVQPPGEELAQAIADRDAVRGERDAAQAELTAARVELAALRELRNRQALHITHLVMRLSGQTTTIHPYEPAVGIAALERAAAMAEELRPIAARAVRAELVLSKWFEAGRQEHLGDTDALVDVFNKVVDIIRHKEPDRG